MRSVWHLIVLLVLVIVAIWWLRSFAS